MDRHRRHRLFRTTALVLFSLVSIGTCAAQSAILAEDWPEQRSARPFANLVDEAARRFAIPPIWLDVLMRVESSANPNAVSLKGAMGLMQIMPDTWADLQMRHHLGADPFDPRDNIMAGAAYFRELDNRFGTIGAFAAYNAGPRRFSDTLTGKRDLPDETQHYLTKLARLLPELPPLTLSSDRWHVVDWRTSSLFPGPQLAYSGDTSNNTPSVRGRTFSTSLSTLSPRSNGLFVVVGKNSQ